MTLRLIDLYNIAATQEWSMYDNDASSQEELEASLVLALNKALQEILYSYNFSFREKTHIILTSPNKNSYTIPVGLIKQENSGEFAVKINSHKLKLVSNLPSDDIKNGYPEYFLIKGNKLIIYPTPSEKSIITIDYYTLAVGENSEGEEIFSLKNENDEVLVPAHLEELLKNAVIARTMLNSIASESDENFSAYKKQSETAYRLLVKYAKGVGLYKKINW